MVIIRIWRCVVSILHVIQLEIVHVSLEEIICTDVVKVYHLLPRILAQTQNDGLGFI